MNKVFNKVSVFTLVSVNSNSVLPAHTYVQIKTYTKQ